MEGWNPSVGCGVNCKSCYRGWVANPLLHFPRRDPLSDAVGRVYNPCERPARCPPSYEALPKFKPPRELPVCNIEEYNEEKKEAKYREEAECCNKYQEWRSSLTPYIEVNSFDRSNRPIQIVDENESAENQAKYVLVDRPVRTNFLTGIFNPDDNKPNEQFLREQCDRFWVPCGPGLRPYPCRGVIDFPAQQLIDITQPRYEPNASICTGTKYVDPDFIQKQYEDRKDYEIKKKMEEQKKCEEIAYNWQRRNGTCYPPSCPTRRCCE